MSRCKRDKWMNSSVNSENERRLEISVGKVLADGIIYQEVQYLFTEDMRKVLEFFEK